MQASSYLWLRSRTLFAVQLDWSLYHTGPRPITVYASCTNEKPTNYDGSAKMDVKNGYLPPTGRKTSNVPAALSDPYL